MASGPLPKRVRCPVCGGPEGMPCRDVVSFANLTRPHPERYQAAEVWYVTPSPDGLTPKRRDEMVEALQDVLRRGDVGKAMQKITTAADPEAEFLRQTK